MAENWNPDPNKERIEVKGACDLCLMPFDKLQLIELHNFKRVLLCVDCMVAVFEAGEL